MSVDIEGQEEFRAAVDDVVSAIEEFRDALEELERQTITVRGGGGETELGVDGHITIDSDLSLERRDGEVNS